MHSNGGDNVACSGGLYGSARTSRGQKTIMTGTGGFDARDSTLLPTSQKNLPPLTRYQIEGIRFAYENERCAIWADPGAGKTRLCLELIRALWRMTPLARVLVLAPKFPAARTWPEQAALWTPELSIEHLPDNWQSSALIHTCNYEQAENLAANTRQRYEIVIVDEATKLQSFRLKQGGKRAQALRKILVSCDRIIELTGTPSSKRLANLWGQVYFLDYGTRLGASYTAFRDRWFVRAVSSPTLIPTEVATTEIPDRVADLCLSIRLSDYVDVAHPVEVTVPVELPAAAMKQYKALERKAFIEIHGEEHRALNAGAKCTKLLQLASGTLYTHNDQREITGVQWLHEAKLDALARIMEEYQEPMLISYWFKPDLENLRRRFKTLRSIHDNGALDDFREGRLDYLAVQPASAGHGLDGLQRHCRAICYYSDSWDMELHDQVLARIGPARQQKIGRAAPVMVYTLCSTGTVDELVSRSHREKRNFQDLLRDRVSSALKEPPAD